ncbi:hypothetical protein SAPIO_CDS7312 [Scedosporium apiospermum]|uniref:Spt3 n=1 Tax=Pseudallescheria apiosperma TaxID=563466 RepID=A0A084G1L3_PSEDA|nr:uncharacterized protein SAPIO_CDS7312 [Scedosporium apiospermum]KEZ41225.1 hypothetical protein SAPIO_CDS7312 [Scedosporium apiospermum]
MTHSSDPVPAGQLGESVETSPTSLDSVLSMDINTLTTTTASPLSQLVEQIVGPALFPTCEPAVSPQTGFDPGSSESSPVPPDTLDELVDFTTIETAETPLQLTKGVSGSSERVLRLDEISPTPPMPQHGKESQHRFRARLMWLIEQMMYVSGETAEPSVETTGIIEDIVRQQVIELLRNCTELAARRGSRSIGINDLIFQIRHDQAKVSRLRTFLSWKDVRKNVKDSDDKGGDADLGAAEDPVGGVVPGGPVDDTAKKIKTSKTTLPWEPSSFYNQEVPERDDEEDEEEEAMNHITLQRLQKADERTKVMTKEEYVTWSEYRQASFTFRKSKRFREWAGFGIVTDSKPSDDIVDILGFLTFEMVQTLTEVALSVKEQEDVLHRAQNGGDKAAGGNKKRKLNQGLFDPPSEGRSPIEPRHVTEAFRRLQQRPKKSRAMLNGTRLSHRTSLNIF